MNNGCCTNCQAKAKMKKSKKLKEETHEEEDMKQKQKVEENKNPKADSDSDNESDKASSDEKKKKKKDILTWQHGRKKKEKAQQGNNKNSFTNAGYNPPSYSARPMMYCGSGGGGYPGRRGGPNPSNWWPVTTYPRGGSRYPPFTMPPPMYGPYGGGGGGYGGPSHPYQSMTRAPMYNGAHISPYPPMAGAFPPYHPPYWQTRPLSDANPMRRYTSYADNYSYGFI